MRDDQLLLRTRKMMKLFGLEEGFGLGREWVIVASANHHMAPYPLERYSALRDHLKSSWPKDVQEIVEPRKAPAFCWHLCLRLGSPAMDYINNPHKQ